MIFEQGQEIAEFESSGGDPVPIVKGHHPDNEATLRLAEFHVECGNYDSIEDAVDDLEPTTWKQRWGRMDGDKLDLSTTPEPGFEPIMKGYT